MGCGVSKDCTAEKQPTSKRKKKFIHACREHLQSAISDISCKNGGAASNRPPHEYTHLRQTPTLEEQGHEQEDNAGDAEQQAIAIDPADNEELEHLENKPPVTQLLHSHRNRPRAHSRSLLSVSSLPHSPSHKSPLSELSISSDGKPFDVRKDQLGTVAYTASPRSNQCYSGISPSRPGLKAKSSSCSPLHADRAKLPSPVQAWSPQSSHSPNKTQADQQLCKDADNHNNIEIDPCLEVVGHACKPVSKNAAVHLGNQPEEIFKSNTDAIIDGFIEDLQNDSELGTLEKKQQEAFESNQFTSRLMAYGNLSSSPNSYMKELLDHFDKSTEPLHMPTTTRTISWQSKLLETIDRDIDNILQAKQAEVAFTSKDPGSAAAHLPVDHTNYESIEL